MANGTTVPQPPDRGTAAYIAEFIGTLALVFFITAAVSEFANPPVATQPGVPVAEPFTDWTVIGLVHVFALFMLIQTLAIVSGAHFNPAVTAAMTVIREIKPIDGAIYVVVQLAGGTLGALLTKGIYEGEGDRDLVNFGAVGLGSRIDENLVTGMAIEGIGTFFLFWAIVGVAVNPRSERGWAALVIGGTLGLLVMIFGPLTGAGFNPARAFGPALVSGEWGGFGDFVLPYVVAPVIGAIIATLLYFRLVIVPGKKGGEGMEPVG